MTVRGINSTYFIGLDLGQRHDYTAIAILERAHIVYMERDPVSANWHQETLFRLRHVERIPLGTTYTDVVGRLRQIVISNALPKPLTVAVDATGVGLPVVDLIRAQRLDCRLVPVVITNGEQETNIGNAHGVPRKALLASIQVLLAAGKLRISSKMNGSDMLLEELSQMRSRGKRHGRTNDLVFATALACWQARKSTPGILERL